MAKWQVKPKLDNPETVKKLEEAFALDCSIPEACFYANISKQTYYNLLEEKPELLDRFTALREKPVLIARQTVVKACKDNADMALKYLERKRKDEFSLKVETNNTNVNLEVESDDLTDEQKKLIASRFK